MAVIRGAFRGGSLRLWPAVVVLPQAGRLATAGWKAAEAARPVTMHPQIIRMCYDRVARRSHVAHPSMVGWTPAPRVVGQSQSPASARRTPFGAVALRPAQGGSAPAPAKGIETGRVDAADGLLSRDARDPGHVLDSIPASGSTSYGNALPASAASASQPVLRPVVRVVAAHGTPVCCRLARRSPRSLLGCRRGRGSQPFAVIGLRRGVRPRNLLRRHADVGCS